MRSFTLMFLLTLAVPDSSREIVREQRESGTITGHTADSAGQRIPGVSVIVLGNAAGISGRATSASDGTYRVDNLRDGVYRVDFEVSGFDITRRNHVRVREGETATVDAILSLSPICECTDQRPPSPLQERAGYVIDESDRPVSHARLTIGTPVRPEEAYADGEGRFRVLLPVEGSWPLTAFDSGFGTMTRQVSAATASPIVMKLKRAGSPRVADTERLSLGCGCPSLFTHRQR